jgi:NADPH-dependent curcumin reductase CurA
MNKRIVLNSRPVGAPTMDNFRFEEVENTSLADEQLLLKQVYVSVDPYLRGRMNDAESYIPPFKLNEPISSGAIAQVLESKSNEFQKGDFVLGQLNWQLEQAVPAKGLNKVDPALAPLSAYLGAIGMTGLTAYFGLLDIGKPKSGETVVVSGAGGAVGSIVGQIAKLHGCRVVGIAGSDKKCNYLKSELGFDEVLNYKTTTNLIADLKTACPKGVDIYFDNVGGEISDAVTRLINKFARIPLCGQIAYYNLDKPPVGPRIEGKLLTKSALMQGFIVFDFASRFPEGIKQLATWFGQGKLKYQETIVEGFENIPQAFLDLFEGKNEGKMIVKV